MPLVRLGRCLAACILPGFVWAAAAAAIVHGDANCDGHVDDTDVGALTVAVFTGTTCARADTNNDGRITSADYAPLVDTLGAPLPTPSPTPTRTPTDGPTTSPTPAGTDTATEPPTETPTPGDAVTQTPTFTPNPTPTLPPCPPGGATLSIALDNPAGLAAVDVTVSGYRLAPSCQAPPDLALTYASDEAELPPRRTGLAPGVWVHTLNVREPATGQVQHRDSVLLAGSGDNELRFTLFPAVATVRTSADAIGAGSLRDALTAAQEAPKPFLIQFADSAFPAGVATAITLTEALPRLLADDVTIDGIDATGASGTRIVDAAGRDIPAVSIGGARNHVLGLGFRNAGASNRDVISISGTAAWGNRIERCSVSTAATGDGIGIDNGAGSDLFETANLVIDTDVSGASDKGIKVTTGAYARVERSTVHDNLNGGLQATLGGHLLARDNVVERNAGSLDAARNGIAANGGAGLTTELTTDGNIVRYNGANGIAVLGSSEAQLANDYLAANTTAGLRVYNRDNDAASAVVQGVTAACNGTHGASVEDTSRADFGGPGSAGHNAFTQNARSGDGDNFRNVTGSTTLALNNQWEQCGRGSVCEDNAIAAYDISDHGVFTAFVPAQAHRSQRAPSVTAARPSAPRAGDVVRLFGSGFNAIDAHTNDAQCADLGVRNRCAPLRGNCVQIGDVAAPVEAVTPTMLAIRMPFTCVEPVPVTVQIQGGGTSTPFTLCAAAAGTAAAAAPAQ